MLNAQVSFSSLRTLSILLVLCTLAACQPAVRTSIITYSSADAPAARGSIRVLPADGLQDNLEFKHFKKGIESRLQKQGYQPTDDDSAEFIAKLHYSVSRQEKDQPQSRVLVGGQLGYYAHPAGATLLIADDRGREFEFVREVSIAISVATKSLAEKAKSAEEIVRVNASSTGGCRYLTVVYDEMLDAIFADLMRPDGSVVNVKVKGDARCPQ